MPNIHQSVVIVASREKVYEAITTTEGLCAWWTPAATATTELNGIARFPFGNEGYVKEMRILELKPNELVKWECINAASEWVGTFLSFQLHAGNKNGLLAAHPEATGQIEEAGRFESASLLIFHHDNWQEYSPMYAECSYTWGRFLRSLKLYCETGTGTPSPLEHIV